MNKNSLLGATALRSAAAFGLALASIQPAFAQETQEEKQGENPPGTLTTEQEVESGQDADSNAQPGDTAGPAAADSEAIIVTGSRIRRPNLESPLPVTSIGGQEFFETGNVSIGDTLNDLPALRSTFGQANSTRFLGTAGLNLLDLRGLGVLRTLVLQNGRRHVGGDVLVSGVAVDVNTIPTDLIERVDVVTGGNSAVYGSDAIAGVVNFILKDDFEGFQLRGQGGVSRYGDAGSYFIAGLWGTNFADDRGNVAINVEYARQQNAWGAERKWLRRNLTVVDSDPAGSPNGSDGNPDRVLNPDFRSVTFGNTGVLRINTGQCGTDPLGAAYLCPFIFQSNGTLVPMTGERVGLGPNGQFIGGNGFGFFEGQSIQVQPQLDRYNINLLSHFDVSEAFVPFVEAKFSRTDSFGTGSSGPAFIAAGNAFVDPNQFFGDGRNRETISIDNPFLTEQARTLICEQRALAGQTCTAATRFGVQQNLSGLGFRNEQARRDTFRIVGGVKGDIGSGNWNYEVALNYGRLKEKTKVLGNLDVQRYLLAADAVVDPASGNIVCRSQIDPDAAFGYYPWVYGALFPGGATPGDPNGAARLAADVAACVPFNPLTGQATDAQRDYLLLDSVTKGRVTQKNAVAFISGDTTGLFELPGGPIGIVIGAEYRADNLKYQLDEDVELGYTFYNAIPAFTAPTAKVKEAFGEIRLPIFKGTPFFEELEVSAAARVSDYSLGNTGTVWAYNGNVLWSPVRGLRLRGNLARSVRAPNQVELFTPFGQNFQLVTDPCDVNAIGGSPNRASNCAAAGVPAGTAITYSSSLPYLSGGNVNLEAETSDSITLGGVVTPSFLPGFSLSADYYNIKVNKVITAVTAQQILNSCYDLPSLDNPFCALFQRAPGTGGHSSQPYGIIANSLLSSPVNFAKLKARGLDMEVAYRGNIGNLGRLDSRLTYTHVFELTQFIDPTNPDIGDRLMSEVGDPQDAFNWNTSLQHGRFTFGYQMRYLSKQIIAAGALGEYEDFFGFEGRDPENEDFAERAWYPRMFYHDVRLGIDVGPKYNFYMGVDNLTDKKPPYNATGIGGGTGIYDSRGRFFYAGAVAKF